MPKKMRSIILLIFIAFLLVQINCTQAYKKIIHNVDPTAMCLDGSPAALYQHVGTQPTKFLLFFGGRGSCGGLSLSQTVQNCYQRSKTYLGSSKYMLDQLRLQGIVSTDPTKSKFATWTKFMFAYCDGAFHQGNRRQAVNYKSTKLYLRGANVTRAHLKYIQEKYNLKDAAQVIVTGVSAGAMASYMWTNQIQKNYVKNPQVVSTILDSGVFINSTSVQTGVAKSQIMLQNLYKLSNTLQPTPLQQCTHNATKGKQWECFFFQFSYSFLQGRILNLISLYDAYDLAYQYEISCVKPGHEGETFINCSAKQQLAIDQRWESTQGVNQKFLSLSPTNHSAWAISCSNHVYEGNWKFYDSQNQTVQGRTVKQAIQQFVLDKKNVINIDSVKWPGNQKCAY